MCEDDSEVEEHWIYLYHSSSDRTRRPRDALFIACQLVYAVRMCSALQFMDLLYILFAYFEKDSYIT